MTYTIKKSEDLSHDDASDSSNSYGEELLEGESEGSKQSAGGQTNNPKKGKGEKSYGSSKDNNKDGLDIWLLML